MAKVQYGNVESFQFERNVSYTITYVPLTAVDRHILFGVLPNMSGELKIGYMFSALESPVISMMLSVVGLHLVLQNGDALTIYQE